MKSIKLIFGTHNNQPVGNFDSINERVYENAYKPFLRTLYSFPEFPITLHYSGTLLQWFEEHRPEFLMLIAEMVKRKQVEVLGGGFYEPVLSVIANSDKLGQIEHLTTFIRSRFGKRPRGGWIAERVWEPYLASILKHSGMEYVFLDDIHFKSSGMKAEELYNPYLTEDQGKTIAVFPLSKMFRDALYTREPEEMIELLREKADDSGERVISIIDDGEKMGDWFSSHNSFYKEKWLEKFISLVLENPWIEPLHPGRYFKRYDCKGKIYIGCTLYEEMLDWLHAPVGKSDNINSENYLNVEQRGSLFRKFLSRYPESNLLYSKMNYVTILVNQIRGDKYKKKASKEELWKGQCNTSYWHGNFDGIYAPHLRRSVYRALIEAEKLTRDDGVFLPSLISVDFDTDGKKEYLFQGDKMNAYVHSKGGVLFELDFLPVSLNYLDTLSRYMESYHNDQAVDNGYDWYLRKAFVDHFFSSEASLSGFRSMQYKEQGDFILKSYETVNIDKEQFILHLFREANVDTGTEVHPIRIEKIYQFDSTGIMVYYKIMNLSDKKLETRFAVENNLALNVSSPDDQPVIMTVDSSEYRLGGDELTLEKLDELTLLDSQNNVAIHMESEIPSGFWSFSLDTYSRTLEDIHKNNQGNSFVFSWDISLDPGEFWENRFVLRLNLK